MTQISIAEECFMKLTFYGLWEDERPKLNELTQKYGFECVATNDVLSMDNAALCKGSAGVSVLGKCAVDEELLRTLHGYGIRYLSTRSIGYNHIDLKAAKKYGFRLCNSQYPPDSVAEFTLMLMLMSLRKYKQALWLQQVNDYALDYLKGDILRDKTVGVVGTGHIGGRVIELLSGFGCRILFYSVDYDPKVAQSAEFADLDTLYAESDIITFHLPLLPATKHMINRDSLKKLKKGVILINTARGELFETEALIEGIESCKIGALAMDVFEGEDGIYHVDLTDDIVRNRDMAYLRQFPNVVLTQHMAFYTQLSMDSMIENSVQGLVDFNESGASRYEIKY